MKKMMTIVEVELIRLDANDMICTSQFGSITDELGDTDQGYEGGFAPSRYNYRGAAIDWDDQDW